MLLLCSSLLVSGCKLPASKAGIGDDCFYHKQAACVVSEIARQANPPDTSLPCSDAVVETPEPRTIRSELPTDESQYWNLSLADALSFGLINSRVLNDLGGTILRNPEAVPSNMIPAIVQTDPRFGIEGALSAFDTRLNVRTSLENNDRALNNLFLSGGNNGRTYTQTLEATTTELVKKMVTGGQVALRNYTEYDRNSAPANLFPSAWTTWYEAEARQPLLQGGGVQFNRIAGPFAQPGYYNGVTIARVNADISQAEFEVGLRDYLSNVENAYWDLHYAYRDLASKVELRDMALEVYGRYKARVVEQEKEEPYRLAQIREQYFRFQQDMQNALTGRRIDGTRTYNGTNPGTFRGTAGVYLAERRLRLLLGVPTSDARLIRPTDEATAVETIMDWELVKAEALSRRPELDRQRFVLRKAELELEASRNYLKPQFDIVGRYRFRGFGQNFIGYDNNVNSAIPAERFQNAYANLMTGQFQESQIGLEFSMPLGYRQGHVAVANAEFRLARERAILHEQERQVVHDVGNAIADLVRAYEVVKTAWERRSAAAEYLGGLTVRIQNFDFGSFHLEQWLEAQRRFAEADSQYYLALMDHQIALKNLNYEKGSLLEYSNIVAIDALHTDADKPKDKKSPVQYASYDADEDETDDMPRIRPTADEAEE